VSPRFAPGDRVRVARREVSGHVRTPRYIRGKTGVVERICGAFRNPEQLAYGQWDGPAVPLYRVRFLLGDVWTALDATRATVDSEAKRDTLDVELYEHWLESEPS
jgi:nitrile hydratase